MYIKFLVKQTTKGKYNNLIKVGFDVGSRYEI